MRPLAGRGRATDYQPEVGAVILKARGPICDKLFSTAIRVCPERRLLRDSNTSEIGGKTGVAAVPSNVRCLDPWRHFANVDRRIAKGSFDHPVEYLGHLEADLTKIDHRGYAGCGVVD